MKAGAYQWEAAGCKFWHEGAVMVAAPDLDGDTDGDVELLRQIVRDMGMHPMVPSTYGDYVKVDGISIQAAVVVAERFAGRLAKGGNA